MNSQDSDDETESTEHETGTNPTHHLPLGGHDEKWENTFRRLRAFKMKYGHTQIPYRYAEDPTLGRWVSIQRSHRKRSTLLEDRVQKLDEIGFEWSSTDQHCIPWEARYQELVNFVRRYGHSQVPIRWSENVPLATWVSTQRQEYKYLQSGRASRLTKERITKLNAVNFVWNAKKKRGAEEEEEEAAAKSQDDDSQDSSPSVPPRPTPPRPSPRKAAAEVKSAKGRLSKKSEPSRSGAAKRQKRTGNNGAVSAGQQQPLPQGLNSLFTTSGQLFPRSAAGIYFATNNARGSSTTLQPSLHPSGGNDVAFSSLSDRGGNSMVQPIPSVVTSGTLNRLSGDPSMLSNSSGSGQAVQYLQLPRGLQVNGGNLISSTTGHPQPTYLLPQRQQQYYDSLPAQPRTGLVTLNGFPGISVDGSTLQALSQGVPPQLQQVIFQPVQAAAVHHQPQLSFPLDLRLVSLPPGSSAADLRLASSLATAAAPAASDLRLASAAASMSSALSPSQGGVRLVQVAPSFAYYNQQQQDRLREQQMRERVRQLGGGGGF